LRLRPSIFSFDQYLIFQPIVQPINRGNNNKKRKQIIFFGLKQVVFDFQINPENKKCQNQKHENQTQLHHVRLYMGRFDITQQDKQTQNHEGGCFDVV
jgi:hypothetical protein